MKCYHFFVPPLCSLPLPLACLSIRRPAHHVLDMRQFTHATTTTTTTTTNTNTVCVDMSVFVTHPHRSPTPHTHTYSNPLSYTATPTPTHLHPPTHPLTHPYTLHTHTYRLTGNTDMLRHYKPRIFPKRRGLVWTIFPFFFLNAHLFPQTVRQRLGRATRNRTQRNRALFALRTRALSFPFYFFDVYPVC